MANRTIHILSGPPASGKSTWAKEQVAANPNINHLSRDALRTSIRKLLNSDDYFPLAADDERRIWFTLIANTFAANPHDIIIDQTTIGSTARNGLFLALKRLVSPHDTIYFHNFRAPLSLCLSRNERRTGMEFVPAKALREMHTKHAAIDDKSLTTSLTTTSHKLTISSISLVTHAEKEG